MISVTRLGFRRWEATWRVTPAVVVVGQGRSRRGAVRALDRQMLGRPS